MKLVVRVALKVERNVKVRDQSCFEEPWSRINDPTHECVLRHPGRELLLAGHKRHALSRANAPQLDAQLVGEKNTERLSKCRAFGIARVVVLDPVSERLT